MEDGRRHGKCAAAPGVQAEAEPVVGVDSATDAAQDTLVAALHKMARDCDCETLITVADRLARPSRSPGARAALLGDAVRALSLLLAEIAPPGRGEESAALRTLRARDIGRIAVILAQCATEIRLGAER